MDRDTRNAAFGALWVLLLFGIAAYFLPRVMLAAGSVSPVLAGVIAALFMVAIFVVFWLRGVAGKPEIIVKWHIGPAPANAGYFLARGWRLAGRRATTEGDADVELTIKDDESKGLAVVFKSIKGNVAKVDGIPVWTTSDSAILTVASAPDGMGATITAVGPVGQAQVVVTADADLGEGVREVIGRADVSIAASEAVVADIQPV